MRKPEAGKHHYLPKFHLNRWKTPKGQLYAYRKQGDGSVREKEKDAAEICFQKGLYTLGPDPLGFEYDRPDLIESEILSKVDNAAAVVLGKMLEGGTDELTGENRRDWAKYIVSLLERHPDRIGYSEQLHKDVGDKIFSSMMGNATVESKMTIEKIKRMVEKVDYHRTQARVFLVDLINDPEWIESLAAFKWKLVNIDGAKGFHFIFTETPVFLLKHESIIYALAIALDPNNLWVAYSGSWEDGQELLDLIKMIVILYNGAVVHENPEFVISDRPLTADRLYKYDVMLHESLKNAFQANYAKRKQE